MENEKRDYGGRNVPVNVAAKIMNKSPQFVRIGIQHGILPIGIAFKTSDCNMQYDYYISPRILADFTGCSITLNDEQDSIVSTKTLISSKSKEDKER